MLIHKLKLTAMSLCLLAVVATGAGWFIRPPARAADPRAAGPPRPRLRPCRPAMTPTPDRPRAG